MVQLKQKVKDYYYELYKEEQEQQSFQLEKDLDWFIHEQKRFRNLIRKNKGLNLDQIFLAALLRRALSFQMVGLSTIYSLDFNGQ